jgi:hypothetical protein
MLSARIPPTPGNPQEDTRHSRLAETISSSHKINLGDKTTRETTPTETGKHAFFARCKIIDKRSAERGSRLTSLAWIRIPFWPKINAADSDPTNPMEGFEAPSFTLQDFQ